MGWIEGCGGAAVVGLERKISSLFLRMFFLFLLAKSSSAGRLVTQKPRPEEKKVSVFLSFSLYV